MNEKQTIRLNKYISDAGICSRREADRLIEAGRVLVDGLAAVQGQRVTENQKVEVDGKEIRTQEKKILLLFHKPRGIVCTAEKRKGQINVEEYLKYPVRVTYVGRLDKDSEGLLLLTNCGDIINKIMRSGNCHEKEYQVQVDRPVTDEFIKGMAGGVPILDTVTRPCKVEKTGIDSFRIILTQGLNRQIRRMCEYFGYQVRTLKRVRIMHFSLGNLPKGAIREATEQEWEQLLREIAHSSNTTVIEAGGLYGSKSIKRAKGADRASEGGCKGLLSGGQGNHEQSGVRCHVRQTESAGGRDRNGSGRKSNNKRRI